MTTYTAIPNSEIDADSPVLASTATKFRDNPLAIAEGDSTAPVVEPKALKFHVRYGYDGGSDGQVTFGSFSGYGAVVLEIAYSVPSSGGPHDIDVEFSDDGVTYYGSVTLRSAADSEVGTIHVIADFESESVRYGGHIDARTTKFTGTGTSTGTTYASTNHVRVTSTASTATDLFVKVERCREVSA